MRRRLLGMAEAALMAAVLASCFNLDDTITTPGPTVAPFLHSVTFGAGQFVAVGDDGVIVTSPDGATWTPQTWGGYTELTGVTYGGGQYVAVGFGGVVLTSTDGVTWVARPVPAPAGDYQAVTYGDGVFVVVGWSQVILESTDGETWTQVYSGVGVWQAVAYVGSEFVAVDRAGGVAISVNAGVTWTVTIVGDQQDSTGACAVTAGPNEEILVLDDAGRIEVATSAGATSLTAGATLWSVAITGSCDVVDDGDTLVATSDEGHAASSSDGKTWTIIPGIDSPFLEGVAFDGPHVVVVGQAGTVVNATCSGGACTGATAASIDVPAPPAGVDTGSSSGGGSGSGSGSGSGGGSCTSQQALMSCPDGSMRCCSTNQVCCNDSANNGAIGCEFSGFCQ